MLLYGFKINAFQIIEMYYPHPLCSRGRVCVYSHLCDERLEEVGFVSEGVMYEPVTEGHDPVREVVLWKPGHHTLLLHVWTSRHVHYQVTQILPVPKPGPTNVRNTNITNDWPVSIINPLKPDIPNYSQKMLFKRNSLLNLYRLI